MTQFFFTFGSQREGPSQHPGHLATKSDIKCPTLFYPMVTTGLASSYYSQVVIRIYIPHSKFLISKKPRDITTED